MIDVMDNKILIVDDEQEMCISLQKLFAAHGLGSDYCTDSRLAKKMIRQRPYQVLISDLKMPGDSGIELIREAKRQSPRLATLMISGYASTKSVVEAMRLGAVNFFEKPVPFNTLLKEVGKILEENQGGTRNPSDQPFITNDPQMQQVLAMARKAAKTDAPVIITGESGTGKELVASIIHTSSNRKSGPFVKINCAALPDTLLESELFGFEKGAFTDAKEAKKGKFEVADGGTMFFDEISDMSLILQAKLLRVLQEHQYERLGSNQIRNANVRFLAASNKDLPACIKCGEFREDLYFRLSVICLTLPPLRARKGDVVLLANKFLEEFNTKYGKSISGIDDKAWRILNKNRWPGNVRELRNCMERAVIFCEGPVITVGDLPAQYQRIPVAIESDTMQSAYDRIDYEMIVDTLRKVDGNRTKAAEALNISRKTLYLKMKKLGIEF